MNNVPTFLNNVRRALNSDGTCIGRPCGSACTAEAHPLEFSTFARKFVDQFIEDKDSLEYAQVLLGTDRLFSEFNMSHPDTPAAILLALFHPILTYDGLHITCKPATEDIARTTSALAEVFPGSCFDRPLWGDATAKLYEEAEANERDEDEEDDSWHDEDEEDFDESILDKDGISIRYGEDGVTLHISAETLDMSERDLRNKLSEIFNATKQYL